MRRPRLYPGRAPQPASVTARRTSIRAHATDLGGPQTHLMTRAAVGSTPSGLLIFSVWASTGVGLLVVELGLYAIANDTSTHADEWDGLGVIFGKLMVAGGLLWSFPHTILALWLIRTWRRGRAPARSARRALLVTGVLVVADARSTDS